MPFLGVRLGVPGLAGGGPALRLSSNAALDSATVGTVIGTLSVTGGTGSYTFSLTSNPGGLFSITTNQLKVAAALTAGSDPIIIKADNGAGSVIISPFTIIVSSAAAFALKSDFSISNNEPWVFW